MIVEAGGARGLFVRVLAPARERNQHGMATPGFEAHAARDLVPAHARHADVDDGGTRPLACRDLERLRAAVGNRDFVAHEPQHQAE